MIFEKDNYTCQLCGKRGVYLEDHHIVALDEILKKFKIKTLKMARITKELWDITNGKTFCHDCHQILTWAK